MMEDIQARGSLPTPELANKAPNVTGNDSVTCVRWETKTAGRSREDRDI